MRKNESTSSRPRGTACLQCKEKKRRCDGLKPVCTTCNGSGRQVECTYLRNGACTEKKTQKYVVLEWKHHASQADDEIAPRPIARATTPVASVLGKEIVILDHSVDWWKLDELPIPMKELLITTFLDHNLQMHFEHIVPSFLFRLRHYAPSHPSYPHPSLLNAIYLVSSFYLSSESHPCRIHEQAKWNPSILEATFFGASRKAIMSPGLLPEHLLDIFLATGLLARYLYCVNKHEEGYHVALGAMRFAKKSDLHKLSDSSHQPPTGPLFLPPPTNELDNCARTAAFWAAYIIDRVGSVYMGEGESVLIPDKDITIPLPVSRHYDQRAATPSTSHISEIVAPDATGDNSLVHKVKYAFTLMKGHQLLSHVAQQGVTSITDLSSDFATEFLTADNSVIRIIDALPPLPESLADTTENIFADMVIRHSMHRAALMRLHSLFSVRDPYSHAKALMAAKEIVLIARMTGATNEIYWHQPLHFVWANACQILQQEITHLVYAAGSCDQVGTRDRRTILVLRKDMEFLEGMLKRHLKLYRFHLPSVRFVEQLLAKDTDFISQLSAAEDSSTSY